MARRAPARLAVLCAALLVSGAVWLLLRPRVSEAPPDRTADAGLTPRPEAPRAPASSTGAAGGIPGLDVAAAALLPPPVDLEKADRDLDLHGVVVLMDATPVAGAEVQVVSYPGRRTSMLDYVDYYRAVEGPRTRTARDGTFSIRLSRGERVSLRVRASGLADLERHGCTAGQRLRIVMSSGARVVVALTDEAGAAVAETSVRLFRPYNAGVDEFVRRADSDAAGRAVFEAVPGGAWAYVGVQPTRLGNAGWRPIDVPEYGEVTVEVVLLPGRTVRGRVTEAATGKPIAGAHVGLGWQLDRAVETDAEGRYEMPGWNDKQGESQIYVRADGFGTLGLDVGARENVDFPLVRGDVLVGRVLDRGGRPLAGARVASVPTGPKAGGPGSEVGRIGETGIDGRFSLTGVRYGVPHALVVSAPGHGRLLLDVRGAEEAGGTVDVGDVALPAPRRIEGRVLYASKEPVPDLYLRLRGANADRERLAPRPEKDEGSYGQREDAFTDDRGRFRFPDLAPGEYVITARPKGGGEVSREVTLGEADVLDVELVLEGGHRLIVTVRDAQGAPLAGAIVSAYFPVVTRDGRSDSIGQVAFDVPDQTGVLNVYWPTEGDPKARRLRMPSPKNLPAGATEAVAVLEETGVIRGVLVSPDGVPVSGRISAVAGGHEVWGRTTLGDGTFEIEVAKDGGAVALRGTRVEPAAEGRQRSLAGEVWDIAPGTEGVRVVLRELHADRRMVVRVLAPDGSPAAGATVAAGTSAGAHRTSPTGPDGRATLDGLTPEAWWIVASPDTAHVETWVGPPSQTLEPDGRVVDLQLRVGRTIEGVILEADGRPSVGRRMQAQTQPPSSIRFFVARDVTDTEGRFRILVDPEAPLPLVLNAGWRTEGGPVEIRSLPAAGLRIRLAPMPR